jgi:hypothetical protein
MLTPTVQRFLVQFFWQASVNAQHFVHGRLSGADSEL